MVVNCYHRGHLGTKTTTLELDFGFLFLTDGAQHMGSASSNRMNNTWLYPPSQSSLGQLPFYHFKSSPA